MTTTELSDYVSNGFERAKHGDALNVYNEITPYFDRGELPTGRHYAFGWIIYYALHQSTAGQWPERRRMLGNYLKLVLTKPHKLHSMILTEAIRLYRDAPDNFSIVRFVKLWGLANLRPGDWRRKQLEGKTVNATVEKLVTAYVNESIDQNLPLSEEFKTVFGRAVKDFADSPRLQRQRARLLVAEGNRRDAAEIYRRILPANRAVYYLWSELAELLPGPSQRRLKAAMLAMALRTAAHEEFRGKIRIAMAETLAAANQYGYALYELDKVKTFYTGKKWHLSPAFVKVRSSIPDGTVAKDPQPVYDQLVAIADNYVMQMLPDIEVSKDYHKEGGESRFGKGKTPAAWRVVDVDGDRYWLTPSRFGIDPNLPIGTMLVTKIADGKIIHAHLLPDQF